MLEIIGLLLPGVTKILDKIIPDADARAEAIENIKLEMLKQDGEVKKAIADAAKAQNDVNLAEAQNPSMFVAGWRPAIGWICGIGLGYQFILWPFIVWVSSIFTVAGPPQLDIGTLTTLLLGMLGLGGLRTYEKRQDIETTQIQKKVK